MKKFSILMCALIFVMLMGVPAHSQVPGQPYQIPTGYEGAPAGASISYGGANYVIQDNGTMLLQEDQGGQPMQNVQVDQTAYQIPAGYGGYAAGTTISYGGASYVIQGNGTMIPAGGYAGGGGGYSVVDQTAYQIPAGYGGYAEGSTLSYGGADYVVQNNVMLRINLGGGGRFGYSSGYSGVSGRPNGSPFLNGQPGTWPGKSQHWPNNPVGGPPNHWPNNPVGGPPNHWPNNPVGGPPNHWPNNPVGGPPNHRINNPVGGPSNHRINNPVGGPSNHFPNNPGGFHPSGGGGGGIRSSGGSSHPGGLR